MTHAFLLIGQSNMAGRGYLGEVPPIFDEGIKMLRNGLWQIMWEPIHYDRPFAGIGLGASFAARWRLAHPDKEIGLIPCAEGGSSLEDWRVDGPLYQHAVMQGKLAQQSGKIAGMLWHQGENDCSEQLAATYGERFKVIIEALRKELQVPSVPLIIGGLGDYLTSGRYGPYFGAYPLVNTALLEFARQTPNCFFVSTKGLTANPDGLHFDAVSQRKLGVRYFEAFDRRQDILTALSTTEQTLTNIYNRQLTKSEQSTLLQYRFAFGELTLQQLEEQLAELR